MDCDGRSLLTGTKFPERAESQLAELRRAVASDCENAYLRDARQLVASDTAHKDSAKLPDGATVGSPAGGVVASEVPPRPISLRPLLCFCNLPASNPSDLEDTGVAPNTQAPKRSCETLKDPPPRRQRSGAGDREFLDRHCEAFRETSAFYEPALPRDYVVAINYPMAGWPSFLDLYGMDGSDFCLQDSLFADMLLDKFRKKNAPSIAPPRLAGRPKCFRRGER